MVPVIVSGSRADGPAGRLRSAGPLAAPWEA